MQWSWVLMHGTDIKLIFIYNNIANKKKSCTVDLNIYDQVLIIEAKFFYFGKPFYDYIQSYNFLTKTKKINI